VLRRRCDVVTINCPLHKDTEGLFDKKLIGSMKKGAYLVNTARGKIVNRDDLVEALESGHLAGCAPCHFPPLTLRLDLGPSSAPPSSLPSQCGWIPGFPTQVSRAAAVNHRHFVVSSKSDGKESGMTVLPSAHAAPAE
jgi:hypothetical protein